MTITKIKSLLLVGLAVFTMQSLSSCSEKDDIVTDEVETGSDIKGYLSLNISMPETRTAPGTGGVENGQGAENDIKTIQIVLTDDAGVVTTVVDNAVVGAVTGGKTQEFQVPVGNHRVYALINSSTVPTLSANIQQVITVAAADDATSGYENGDFMMVNAKHNEATNAGIPVTVSASNIAGSPASVSINVDRVSAKINPKISDPDLEITTLPANFITDVVMEGYLLLNVNKQFNLVQKWGEENANSSSLATLGSEALQTPLYTPGGSNLVKNQYFLNISEYTTLTKVGDDVTEIAVNPGITATAMGTAIYTTENRPTIKAYGTGDPKSPTAGQGETTGIIYKVKAKNTAGNLGTFYEYKSQLYMDLDDVQEVFDGSETLSEQTEAQLRGLGIKVFEDGIMYYTFFIKGNNSNANHKWGTGNYYGVFRNSVYNLTVNKLTRVGDDVPGGGIVDPEDPDKENPDIDTDEAYIDVTVVVNPWVLNDIPVEL